MGRYIQLLGALLINIETLIQAQAIFPGNLNPCRKDSCQNGGTCIAPMDYPECLCAPGFYGTNCEFSRNPCFNFTCFNGGRCTAPLDLPYCQCRPGYTGRKCETKVGGGNDSQCPIVRPSSIGSCRGVTCSLDSDCAKGEKCCKTACGSKRCTGVQSSDPVDLVSLCFLTDCEPDRICRAALPCATCQPVATCIPLATVAEGLDSACQRQNYWQVLLIQSATSPDTYNRLRCRRSMSLRDCPQGSVCVDDMRGGGVCCFGKPLVVEKPGTCPTKQLRPRYESLCVGTLCQTDEQCSSTQKCCDSSCGTKICTDVVSEQLICPGGCPKGYICEYRPYPCPPGQFCIQIVIPTCVPLVNRCGGCPELQVCVLSDEPCLGFNCPNFVCVPNDECGGCLPGLRCEIDHLSCTTPQPCDSMDSLPCLPVCEPVRRCVPIDTTPAVTDACGGCPSGQECQFILPPCPPPPGCDTPDLSGCTRPFCVPVPRCVPAVITPAPVDPCRECRKGQVCIDTGLRCVTTPCPTYQCVTNNSCGGCPPGQSCQEFLPVCPPPRDCDVLDPSVPCIISECKPIYSCVPDAITPADECGGCPKGQACRFTGRVCKKAPCPSYTCLDKED